MTPEDLNRFATIIYGRRWQKPLGEALNMNLAYLNQVALGKRPMSKKVVAHIKEQMPLHAKTALDAAIELKGGE